MNELNYGSREACERLVKAGIVLETEKMWIYARHIPLKGADKSWKLFDRQSLMAIEATDQRPDCILPAPSMAEAWRELPENTNPIDALIYLRIWLEERKEGT